jgi:hypothetical protein
LRLGSNYGKNRNSIEEDLEMRKMMGCLLGLGLLLGGAGIAGAQGNAAGMNGPPKVLTITREFTKPGRGGMMHDRAESAFVQAMAKAKWPTHYLAMASVTGKPRVLFLTGYDSFADWEKDVKGANMNAELSAELDRAAVADGDLLSDMDQAAWIYREDQSQHPNADIPRMRYFEISVFHVKQGHGRDWDEAVRMVKAAYAKGMPNVQWAMYQAAYGAPEGTYLVITPRKSAAEIDEDFANDPKFAEALGKDGMKKLDEISAAAIESVETNLFAFNPRMSYVSEDYVKADPEFWKPKPLGMTPGMKKKAPAAAAMPPAEAPNQ